MKRALVTVAVAALLLAPVSAVAADRYDDTQSHPLRVAAYLLHPVGLAAEWLIFRPLHFVFASSGPVFGHRPHGENVID